MLLALLLDPDVIAAVPWSMAESSMYRPTRTTSLQSPQEVKSLNKAVRNFEVYRLLEESLKAMLTSLPLVQVRGCLLAGSVGVRALGVMGGVSSRRFGMPGVHAPGACG
jgi:hypothetical protein